MPKPWLAASEVVELLNIKPATLYSYVSRGLIRSQVANDDSREHRYLAQDVYQLAERKAQRRDPARVARNALHWGEPVLESALTLIHEGRLYYRGTSIEALVETHTFEEVAALLWTNDLTNAARLFPPTMPDLPTLAPLPSDLPMAAALQITLAQAMAHDISAYNLSAESVIQTGARILYLMAGVVVRNDDNTKIEPHRHREHRENADGLVSSPVTHDSSLASYLASHWCPDAVGLLNTALIVCADHELNASSFTARVVAGVDANPYAVVIAGLSALQGIKHGANTGRVSAFLREVYEPRQVRGVIGEYLRRGEHITGFGHTLYTEMDPRAAILLAQIQTQYPDHPVTHLSQTVIHEVQALIGKAPNIDFALAVLEMVLALPRGTALALFALGRTAGWLGHALEQYQTQQIIRPRAHYTGQQPE